MANLLNRFNKDVLGSENRLYDYLSKVNSTGDFTRIRDIDVIISSWNNILLTPKGTYIHDPNYGSNLFKLLFEPVDDTTVESIKDEVIGSIITYDDRASIKDIQVLLRTNRKGFQINITAEYKGETKNLSVSINDKLHKE